jgi:hypothetical protein
MKRKPVNTICGQSVDLFNVKTDGKGKVIPVTSHGGP